MLMHGFDCIKCKFVSVFITQLKKSNNFQGNFVINLTFLHSF